MSQTPPGTVKETGAERGQILVGIDEEPLNRGLRIRVHDDQAKVGGRIEGSFDLLDASDGTYAKYLANHVGKRFNNAAELIEEIWNAGEGAKNCRHILNRNKLRELSVAGGAPGLAPPPVLSAPTGPPHPRESPPYTPRPDNTARLRTLKLVLEVVAAAITVIGGIIALVWRFG